MRRSWILLTGGVLLALLAYFGLYYAGTAGSRKLQRSPEPELAWLKQEFRLSDAEYARLCQMHQGYLQGCAERCQRIDAINEHLKDLLAATNAITPEIQATLAQAAQLRAECQTEMLRHFFEVSRTMPPEQGKRYLAWVQAQTILPDAHSHMGHEHMDMDGR
jgi:hypothetical protein